jgi:hypothetical protein
MTLFLSTKEGNIFRGGAAVFLGVFFVFLPSLDHDFVNWDDTKNFLENPDYRGLGWKELRWMFTTLHAGHYIPITWCSLGLDHLIWEMHPFGYHLTNVLLHSANAVILYLLLMHLGSLGGWLALAHSPEALQVSVRGTPLLGPSMALAAGSEPAASKPAAGASWVLGCVFGALFFGLHPLRVESVSWVTERRDVLSGAFALACVLSYLRGRRAWAFFWFALAVGSKEICVATLPLLLVLDRYVLNRLGGKEGWFGEGCLRVWLEKISFLALAGFSGWMAVQATAQVGDLLAIEERGLSSRLAQAVFGLCFYLLKTLFPVNLSVLYPFPQELSIVRWPFSGYGLAVLAVSLAFFRMRRHRPAGWACWISYLLLLAPVLGTMESVSIANDRFSYLSCMVWAFAAAWGFHRLHSLFPRPAVWGALLLLLGWGFLTWQQQRVWNRSGPLWSQAIRAFPRQIVGFNNLGSYDSMYGLLQEAEHRLKHALRIEPYHLQAYNNLGVALRKQGRLEEARAHYETIDSFGPGGEYLEADVYHNMGLIYQDLGELDKAIAHYRKSLALRPGDEKTSRHLQDALARADDDMEGKEK